MNKKKYFEYILPVIEPILERQGFIFKKSKDSFEKKIFDGLIKIQFNFYDFALTYNINIGFETRINKVQDIFVRYKNINSVNHKDSSTINFALAGLINHTEKVFRFKTVGELDAIISEKFIPFLEKDVPVFCKKYKDMESIFDYYYTPSKQNSDFMEHKYDGHIMAVIIARLLGRTDFEEVVKWADNGLKKLQLKWASSNEVEWYETFFDKMVNDLRII